jgi:hypothetical protein
MALAVPLSRVERFGLVWLSFCVRPRNIFMTPNEPDGVMRWLTIGLSLPLFTLGFWGLLMPQSYQKALVGLSGRLPDQARIAAFVRFVTGRNFILLLRLFSAFPIVLAIGLLCTLR